MTRFDPSILSESDRLLAEIYSRGRLETPDFIIAPDGEPYIYRWHVVPRNREANVYFHIQVASDPDRGLHDHPWHNTTVILSGGYDEQISETPELPPIRRQLRRGDVKWRPATAAHRLILPAEFSYAMTLFTTGPKIRDWGFYTDTGWRDWREFCEERNGMSMNKELLK